MLDRPAIDDATILADLRYGTGDADPLLIAWYRIDWALQALADFPRPVLLDPDVGDATRANALQLFAYAAEPCGEVETAIAADDALA